jgi:hypothetical protein
VIAGDRARFARQCDAILDRLQSGPASNIELAKLSLKYTGRVSDLRKQGYEIKCDRLPGGKSIYRLVTVAVGEQMGLAI